MRLSSSVYALPLVASSLSVDAKQNHHRSPSAVAGNLFPPLFVYGSGYTTANGVFVPGIEPIDLSDDDLNVFKSAKGLTHAVTRHRGKVAWEAVYPQGSTNPGNSNGVKGGFGFYGNGSDVFEESLKTANEVMISYSVLFEAGFDFVKGGKLPGGCACTIRV